MDPRIAVDEHVAVAVDTMALLASASRLRIVHALLHEHPLAVSDIAALSGLSSSATSQHLNRMRRAGVLTATKDGVNVRYELADHHFAKLADAAFWYAEHVVDVTGRSEPPGRQPADVAI